MSEELKPCPLCGGRAEIWRAHPEGPKRKAWIACVDRCLVLTREYDTTEEAIAAWNRRAPSVTRGQIARAIWENEGGVLDEIHVAEIADAILALLRSTP